MRKLLFVIALLSMTAAAYAQKASDYRVQVDTLRKRLLRSTTVRTGMGLQKVLRRDNELDFYFSQDLADYPWREKSLKDLYDFVSEEMVPKEYTLGKIFGGKIDMADLAVPEIGKDGKPVEFKFKVDNPPKRRNIVTRVGAPHFKRGLAGRHIALWQSHGRYYDKSSEIWRWQRAPVLRTVEDLYTQSYVLNYLIPMLENAGAYVLTPRERDINTVELIADNDPSFKERGDSLRLCGSYTEKGPWQDAGVGFADAKPVYAESENPFYMGTARSVRVDKEKSSALIIWTAHGLPRGNYGVYISYKTLSSSTSAACYRVSHLGGETEFVVNQQMGGGMWIWLGNFEMDSSSSVILDNHVPEGYSVPSGAVVSADAVRIGGGMGKIDRGGGTSGLPCYAEGALCSMLFSGFDATLFGDWDNDYTRDYAGRGAWASKLSGGSSVNPKTSGRKIPLDMTLAFHTDAGLTQNDSIIGTLAIYTSKCDNKDELPNGESRLTSRTLADMVQSQIVGDLRARYNPKWTRRGTWDRSYSESRTTSVPALLLELLSHQNFADMLFGQDPQFQFDVCRAVYKGVLKYLSARYGVRYTVQPLPVRDFSALLSEDLSSTKLSWRSVIDSLEPTAAATSFRLETRLDGKGWGNSEELTATLTPEGIYTADIPLEKGHIQSFRIRACNDGGVSFPSEILSVGVPRRSKGKVLIVNDFTRVCGPTSIDLGEYAGFVDNMDSGVPYIRDITFIGEQYSFFRSATWSSNSDPGFGGSYTDCAASVHGGNTFDYPFVHGKAFFDEGWAFASVSASALSSAEGYDVVDLVCGKQRKTVMPWGKTQFQVFPEPLKFALTSYCSKGGKILVSGAYIASDATADEAPFLATVLGYKPLSGYGSRACKVQGHDKWGGTYNFNGTWSPDYYRIEHPDGISPAGSGMKVILRYTDTGIPAAVAGTAEDGHRAAAFGFPLEVVNSEGEREKLLRTALKTLTE